MWDDRLVGSDHGLGAPAELWHGTTEGSLAGILALGLPAPSYWGTKRMAEHWARLRSEERGDGPPVLLRRALADFDEGQLFWDDLMEEEPVWFDYVVEADRDSAAALAAGRWEESLAILESVVCGERVLVRPHEVVALEAAEELPEMAL